MDRNHFLQTFFSGGLFMGLNSRTLFSEGYPDSEKYTDREALTYIWRTSAELTMEFAKAMPAGDYLFKPSDMSDIYTYGRQMQHIAENNISLLSNYLTEQTPPDITLGREDDKVAILENISSSFEYGIQAIENLSPDDMMEVVDFFARPLPRWHVLFIAQDHTTHHCGQAVIYLNAKGIEPPSYRKW